MKIELFYDKDCPFCNKYANYVKLKEKHELLLKNAREFNKEIRELKTLGFDINDGFIIKVDENKIYQGVDAIVFLNKLVKKKFYFPDNCFFRSIVYPFIKLLRRVVLIILRKKYHL